MMFKQGFKLIKTQVLYNYFQLILNGVMYLSKLRKKLKHNHFLKESQPKSAGTIKESRSKPQC